MNKKGFTLVELLAVIVILAIILAIAIPSITGLIQNSRKNAFESDIKMILSAIRYRALEDDTFNVEVLNQNNIDDLIAIPNTNYTSIAVHHEDGTLNIMVVGRNRWDGLIAYGTSAKVTVVRAEDYDVIPPIITMLGTSPAITEQGSIYNDAGAMALDNLDGDITNRIVVTNTVDTGIIGTYYVTYNVSDNAGNVASPVTRTVIVIDSEPPIITMLGQNPVTILQGSVYNDAGATATDNIDGNLTANIIVTSNVNPSQTGTYSVTYNVADTAGNHATPVVRTVNVLPTLYTFTNAAAIGRTGPSQAQINTAYSGTTLAGKVTVSGGIQLWTVPYSGTYRIETWGAQGGNGSYLNGGSGARMRGDFVLTQGTILKILVGQRGESNASYKAGGGGGGSFVTLNNNSPLIIAGGGGGGGGNSNEGHGYPGVVTTSGSPGTGGYSGGSNGNGGAGGPGSGGGGGLLTNGGLGFESKSGVAFVNGGFGGERGSCTASSIGGHGGFGGGSGGEWCSSGAAGPGGGYSGGAGTGSSGVPGGGGSFNNGTNPSNTGGARTGNGLVTITILN